MVAFAATEYEPLRECQEREAKLFSLLLKICRNAYACHYQQNTFPGDTDPCGKCANCMADEILGVNWEKAVRVDRLAGLRSN